MSNVRNIKTGRPNIKTGPDTQWESANDRIRVDLEQECRTVWSRHAPVPDPAELNRLEIVARSIPGRVRGASYSGRALVALGITISVVTLVFLTWSKFETLGDDLVPNIILGSRIPIDQVVTPMNSSASSPLPTTDLGPAGDKIARDVAEYLVLGTDDGLNADELNDDGWTDLDSAWTAPHMAYAAVDSKVWITIYDKLLSM